ncbi:uncharacterized protein L969DRAFT_92244 [Mixia osmundae IAM 14324]|uniref:Sulfotransferase domain-containing protein n=1 Tax=Mixia osmundae (strain CBS 9802 / IAM 14324 / JCM 22182 / KY 12970) TaxID=764103 RepID=G7DTJ4_MIXOS|nr:uncharacterized protein L969DRAFT_92244 [Mixia osmundae IAM 14324]KEI42822.1 hypothetical protein L969DRAFT_92244 [Mixia osmundae IAM 14324]GAA93841.1 hypothetical protein E5Q_00487 [Mixia osmundae IAM 14324]
MTAPTRPPPSNYSLLLHGIALLFLYSMYGVLQEKIMKTEYGARQERFTSSSVLVLCNRLLSLTVGVLLTIMPRKRNSTLSDDSTSMLAALAPQSAWTAYAAVAGCNFLSTFSQYEALKYVSFTAQSIAKCSKMVPVLLVGALVYKKAHKTREWVAGATVLLGCACFVVSRPASAQTSHHGAAASGESTVWTAACGMLLLLSYLFFDAMTSTTQESVFGKMPVAAKANPFARGGPIIDQMIYVNICSAAIAFCACIASVKANLLPSLALIVSTPALAFDVLMLSMTATCGLIVLFNTIALYGALTSAMIMTLRQFISIILNAALFGNFAVIGLLGWAGVGLVASGVWIKMDRRWDEATLVLPPTPASGSYSALQSPDSTLNEREAEAQAAAMLKEVDEGAGYSHDAPRYTYTRRLLKQYLPPYTLPFVFALMASIVTSLTGSSVTTPTTAPSLLATNVTIEGGKWAEQLHSAVRPDCAALPRSTVNYPHMDAIPKTVFASFPRSGNSYLRSLVERSTGYRTASIYCDRPLQKTFRAECESYNNTFLLKSHYPWGHDADKGDADMHWQLFDRSVRIIRNPLDTVFSLYNFALTHSHTGRVEDLAPFGDADRVHLARHLNLWSSHEDYWSRVPIQEHLIRYEDLHDHPLPEVMSLLAFLLPKEEMPSLQRISCSTELNAQREAYHSSKNPPFYTWDNYEPATRSWLINEVKLPWCKYGYEALLRKTRGVSEIDCNSLTDGWDPNGAYAHTKRSNPGRRSHSRRSLANH